jgi:deoxyribodipyrimidine photolyase-like uncharacterized protein
MRNEATLAKNPRIGMGYQLLKKMSDADRREIQEQAQSVLRRIESL